MCSKILMHNFGRGVTLSKKLNIVFSRNYALVTSLNDFHVENGGKMVDFSGFMLPVQYSDQSIVNSHLHTRRAASLFDVSHMLQTEIRGKECIDYMESIVPADLQSLPKGGSTLTVFTNEKGGILDDLIITKVDEDNLYVVSNAGRIQHDKGHMQHALQEYKAKNKDSNIHMRFLESTERSLIALQGPLSSTLLQPLLSNVDLSKMYFMTSIQAIVCGVSGCRLTRCGYTGEDGFEISVPSGKVVEVVKGMLDVESGGGRVRLAGLGARDSLRLEAGLCLYGNDISVDTTPSEAALNWLIPKSRRQDDKRSFPGRDTIVNQISKGVLRKRVGLISTAGPPARQGTLIMDANDKSRNIGMVTSGCPSPSLPGKNISMGYVSTDSSANDTNVLLKIREKFYDAKISKMPFVKANYYNKPKQ